MKVGIIRCLHTEQICPGTTDFRLIREHGGSFAEVPADEPIEIIGFLNCGGCPGKSAVFRAKEMVKRGADTIAFTTCMSKGAPIGFACPHYEKIKSAVIKAVGPDVKILDYTH